MRVIELIDGRIDNFGRWDVKAPNTQKLTKFVRYRINRVMKSTNVSLIRLLTVFPNSPLARKKVACTIVCVCGKVILSFGAESLWWWVAENLRSCWPVPYKAPCFLERTANTNHHHICPLRLLMIPTGSSPKVLASVSRFSVGPSGSSSSLGSTPAG